jgi:hypothetical protein
LHEELEHLKIKKRLISSNPVNVMGEYVMGEPSIFKMKRRAEALAEILPVFALS